MSLSCYVTRRPFSETSSKCDSDIIRDNKKMESIPLESGKMNPGYQGDRQESGRRYPLEQPQTTKSNPLYRDDFGDQRKGYQTDPERRYQDHDRISRGSYNPQISNDLPRTESSGNRQPVKHNYYNDSEPSYRDQRESENSYRPRGLSSERNNPRGRPEEISRDRNNSRGWSGESSKERNKPLGRSEEFDSERNNQKRWPEENSNDRNYPKGRSEQSSIGDDRYVYIEGDGGVRRLFKRVEDKDLGEVCILSIQFSLKLNSRYITLPHSQLKGYYLITTVIFLQCFFIQLSFYLIIPSYDERGQPSFMI